MSVATQAKERPIRFNATDVLAIIEGRKTQTRLVIKDAVAVPATEFRQADYSGPLPCPFGKPGDRLWVQETFAVCADSNIFYRAGGGPAPWDGIKWKPSIQMPRGASRITLEIVSVRVERLNDISEADAKAEGVEPGCLQCGENCVYTGGCGQCLPCYRDSFAGLWRERNGADSWIENPWVWVGEFRVVD